VFEAKIRDAQDADQQHKAEKERRKEGHQKKNGQKREAFAYRHLFYFLPAFPFLLNNSRPSSAAAEGRFMGPNNPYRLGHLIPSAITGAIRSAVRTLHPFPLSVIEIVIGIVPLILVIFPIREVISKLAKMLTPKIGHFGSEPSYVVHPLYC